MPKLLKLAAYWSNNISSEACTSKVIGLCSLNPGLGCSTNSCRYCSTLILSSLACWSNTTSWSSAANKINLRSTWLITLNFSGAKSVCEEVRWGVVWVDVHWCGRCAIVGILGRGASFPWYGRLSTSPSISFSFRNPNFVLVVRMYLSDVRWIGGVSSSGFGGCLLSRNLAMIL